MADFSSLITTIRASINANGRGAITGNLLQAQLVAIINAINTAKEDTGDYPTTTQMSSAISTALAPYIKTTEVQTLLSQTLASYSTSSQMAQAIAAAIAPLATDSAVVHKTGAESISGEKSFNGQVNMLGGANVTGDFTADFSKIIDINTGENVAQLSSEIGDLSDLETTDKSSLVNAINEARQSGGGGGSTTIVDNLTSDSTTSALSAKQGKVLKGLVDAKQDAISDLATIRSGASLGVTALQSVPNTYRTASEQDAIHDSTKQNVISDLTTIRSGASLGATSLQNVKTLLCGDHEMNLDGEGYISFPLINGHLLFDTDETDILGVTIDDNLTSTETEHALSAKQGKVLKGLIDNIQIGSSSSSFFKFINHRGFNTTAPENTLPAFAESYKKGFKYVECDVAFTSDNVAVILHDSTIDRTSNGSGSIASLTFEQVREYDFGSWKSSDFEGTKIPKLEEFLNVCRNLGLKPYIEIKSDTTYTDAQLQSIVDMVKASGIIKDATFISFSSSYLQTIVNYDPTIRVGFVVNSVSSSTIQTATALKSTYNEVFIDTKYTTSIESHSLLCQNANIPLEVWTLDDISKVTSLPKYISGVTTNGIVNGEGSLITKTLEDCYATPEEETTTFEFNDTAARYAKVSGNGRTYIVLNITDTSAFSINVAMASSANIKVGIQFHKESNITAVLAKSTDPSAPSTTAGSPSYDSGWITAGNNKTASQSNYVSGVTGIILSYAYSSNTASCPTLEEIRQYTTIVASGLESY